MEKRYTFRHVNELTGLLVLGVVALVLAGLIFSGHSQRWFARKYAFDVLLPEEGALGLPRRRRRHPRSLGRLGGRHKRGG